MHDVVADGGIDGGWVVAHFANAPDDMHGHVDGHGCRTTPAGEDFLGENHVVQRCTAPTEFLGHHKGGVASSAQLTLKVYREGPSAIKRFGTWGKTCG